MNLKMMSRIIIRREFNRSKCFCVLPFCYKLDPFIKPFVESNQCHIQRHFLSTISERKVENKDKSSNSLEENPYFAKYSDKIKKTMKENPNVSTQPSLNHLKPDPTINMKYEDNKSVKTEEISNKTKEFKDSVQKLKSTNSLNKSLEDILKLDLLKDKSNEEITQIWKSYHQMKDCIYAVIPSETYDRMSWMSSKYKTFIFPVPRTKEQQTNENNYEFILSQFVGHKCFFTPLIAYQTHKELAPVCLTVHHFPELQKDKQIVLMLGEYDSNLLNSFEAQCLANQLQWYYSAEQNMRQTILLHRFNCEPSLFDHMQVIDELENNILSVGMNCGQQKTN